MNVSFEFRDTASPFLMKLRKGLVDQRGMNAAIAARAEQVTREYVLAEAPQRHKTAEGLGAEPTGHLTKAAEAVESRAESDAAFVSFPRSTGLQRAFGNLRIVPRRSKFITIPISARSYGKRAREFNDTFFIRSKNGNLLLAQAEEEDRINLLYVLVKEVNQPQDRDLLPSDSAYRDAIEVGARDHIREATSGTKGGLA